jgi:threonine dehydratase
MIRITPLVRHGDVALKLENLQNGGSFKLRGATRRLAALGRDERAAGVITASAGNHGVGLALAAGELALAATVVVPRRTPAIKRDRIVGLGAEVVVEGDSYDEAEVIARRCAAETGQTFVPAFEDDEVIAGNGGDLATELLAQDAAISRIVVPVGGGGLIAGLSRALAPRGIAVIGVQPENNCAMHESFQERRWIGDYVGRPTIAEGCEGAVGERCYTIASRHVDEIALVSEDAIRRAVAHLYREAGTVAECSGAVALAGVLEGAVAPASAGTTVVVITGGNIEPALLDDILRAHG